MSVSLHKYIHESFQYLNLDFHLSFPICLFPSPLIGVQSVHREVNGLNTISCATAHRELSRIPTETGILQGRIVVCRTNPCNPLEPEDPTSQEKSQRRASSTGEQCKANGTCLDKNQNPNPDLWYKPLGISNSHREQGDFRPPCTGVTTEESESEEAGRRKVFFSLKSHLEKQLCSDLLKISLPTIKERRPTPRGEKLPPKTQNRNHRNIRYDLVGSKCFSLQLPCYKQLLLNVFYQSSVQ